MGATPITDDVCHRAVSEFKMLRAAVSRVSSGVAGRACSRRRESRGPERAAHARFIERGYSFGISTQPDEG